MVSTSIFWCEDNGFLSSLHLPDDPLDVLNRFPDARFLYVHEGQYVEPSYLVHKFSGPRDMNARDLATFCMQCPNTRYGKCCYYNGKPSDTALPFR